MSHTVSMFRRTTSLTLLLILFTFHLLQEAHGQSGSWKLRKDKDGIQVYTRSSSLSDMDEFKGSTQLPFTVDQIVAVIKDVTAYTKWAPSVIHAEHLKTEGAYHYRYTENEAPFPVSNRDSYARFQYVEVANGVRVDFEAVPDYGPEKRGKVRVQVATGFWLFENIGDKKTQITYQVLAEPGGSIPAWLTNSAAVDTPFDSLVGLRDYLTQLYN